jgi:hypothetical protein
MKPKPTVLKREREKAKRAKQQQKAARRAEASATRRVATPGDSGGEDPDIAGIRLGPQPPPDWLQEEE